MTKRTGFTLIELMITVAIVGILLATAIPTYHTLQQRAYGQEATLMAKKIIDGQIIYFLENNDFFPPGNGLLLVPDPVDPNNTQTNIDNIQEALKIYIPADHNLNYQLDSTGDESFNITIDADFPLFKGGDNMLIGQVYKDGKIEYFTFKK